MPQQYKIDKVNDLTKVFDSYNNYFFVNYKGLTVEKITALRKSLRPLNSKLIVMKNSYVDIIAKNKNLPSFDKFTVEQTAVAFAGENSSEVVKALFNSAKENNFTLKGGYADGAVMNDKQLEAFSKMPGKKEMLAMVMATMQAPTQNFVYACNDVIGRFVRVVKALEEQKSKAS